MDQTWTIGRLLNWVTAYFSEKRMDSARLCAEILLSYVLKVGRIELYTSFDRAVAPETLGQLRDLVKRAAGGEPVAYLTGRTEFYSLSLEVNRDCLIPRPETELLVERAIEFLRLRDGEQAVCDLCTGCGCIAVAIAKNFPRAKVIATDICSAALETAAKNVAKYGLSDKIKLLCGDLFSPLIEHLDKSRFDLIVCNPPYISEAEFAELGSNVRDYEPKTALYGGIDGLDIYRRLIAVAADHLKSGGAIMVEIGYQQGPAVRQMLEKQKLFSQVVVEKDFSDNDRIVRARLD
ncbi:MAG: peptide chain release factor N(5)-glutamine methyltransferase [Phycisphaerae bacterium]|nr:peptide chain release factor N(5)-glutamine methyltransferase [Phycisphaerae bacterium]